MRMGSLLSGVLVLSCIFAGVICAELESLASCNFPAIFNFGDSNSDTGCMAAAFYPMVSPYGETFFHEPAGRASDGRLIIDFIAKNLGFPYLNAYIDSIGTSYRHGANFAAGSSTIRRPDKTFFDGSSPFSLGIQTAQFEQFKARTSKLYTRDKAYTAHFPNPDDCAKAIYTFDIGQNDIAAGIGRMNTENFTAEIPDIIENFATAVQTLYQQGARTFWIHNTGPIGCLGVTMHSIHKSPPGYADLNGCVNFQNNLAKEFNRQLKDKVVTLRYLLPDAALTYVDIYSAKYELISNARKEGFLDASNICCGYHLDDTHVFCGNKGMVNGTEFYAGSCEYPSKYISWDGVHYTEAANSWIAFRILNGTYSDPPLPITVSCHSQ